MCEDEKCVWCGNTAKDAEIMHLPCCGKLVCYDGCVEATYCGSDEPLPCPECGQLLVWYQDICNKEDCGLAVATVRDLSEEDLVTVAEIARVGLKSKVARFRISEEVDLADEELERIEKLLAGLLN